MTMRRALGCMYGQLIGDALGCRYEFKRADAVRQMIANDRRNEADILPILGGGPCSLPAGARFRHLSLPIFSVTDDSEMALSLATSLCRIGQYDVLDVACSYVAWAQSHPLDIGQATRNALTIARNLPSDWRNCLGVHEKSSILHDVHVNVAQNNAESLSNGCLMRISPLAIFVANKTIDVKEVVKLDCSLTHVDDDCIQGVLSFVVAIRELLNGKDKVSAFEAAANAVKSERISKHLMDAKNRPIPVKIGSKMVDGDAKGMGYIGVALQSAFYELLHAKSFSQGLIDAISRGGDTDTNGAIAAALLGAHFGVESIPKAWIETVKKCDQRPFIKRIAPNNYENIVEKLLSI